MANRCSFLFPLLGILALAPLCAPPAFSAEAPKDSKDKKKEAETDPQWDAFWKDCYDLNLPYFQARIEKFKTLLSTGSGWQQAMALEKANVDRVTNEACKKWAENPNGDTALKEFLENFSPVAMTARDLKKQKVVEIGPQLDAWMQVEGKELQPYGFKFQEFPCGKAFVRIEKEIDENLKALEDKFAVLKAKCPIAADEVIANSLKEGVSAKTTTFAEGAGKIVPKNKNQKNGTSDITGLKQEENKEAEGEAILKKQAEEAKKQTDEAEQKKK